jgi:hypothetical protein
MIQSFLIVTGFLVYGAWAETVTLETPVFSRRESRKIQRDRIGSAVRNIRSVSDPDSIVIKALLIEFKSDTSTATAGTGRFGFRTDSLPLTLKDEQELAWYDADTVYTYDDLPRNGRYFKDHLAFLQNYFRRVSRGNLRVGYDLYPSQGDLDGQYPDAYQVPLQMTRYSPGEPRYGESDFDYSIRRTTSLLRFIRDAVVKADTAGAASPFSSLVMDEEGTLWEVNEAGDSTRAFVLVFHAGSSYLTDGGGNPMAADSPSDMIDVFVSNDFFTEYYEPENDTVFAGFVETRDGRTGIRVAEDNGSSVLIGEVMMCPETSNQDSLNWGINGILVNQLARQLGAPTLNTAGFPAIGAFGIMDYAGYSSGKGFLPPYPSAFTRYFMGWDEPQTVFDGEEIVGAAGHTQDTEILKIPLNEYEYFLVENRQRNLSDTDPFVYDTTDDVRHISRMVNSFYFDSLDLDISRRSSVIRDNTSHFDIGLPGSGLLVWHVDEKIIEARIEYDRLNMDSSYRAVSLKEADGIMDIGVEFVNALGQRIDDYGGPEDYFPHFSSRTSSKQNYMGPFTAPSTMANDGGNTFLHLNFSPRSPGDNEIYYLRKGSDDGFDGYRIENYVDSAFTVSISGDDPIQKGFVRKKNLLLGAREAFEPLYGDFLTDFEGENEVFVVDSSGYYFFISPENEIITDSAYSFFHRDITGDSTRVYPSGMLPSKPQNMPTSLDTVVLIPARDSAVYRLFPGAYPPVCDTLPLPFMPTTPVVTNEHSYWTVGGRDGHIAVGKGDSIEFHTVLDDSAAVTGAASFNADHNSFVYATASGFVQIADPLKKGAYRRIDASARGVGHFSVVAGSLTENEHISVVLTDRENTLYILNCDSLGTAFERNVHTSDRAQHFTDTYTGYRPPRNYSGPVLSDVDNNGNLDILVSGTNGVYAFDTRANLKRGWPAQLDTRFWSIRGSVLTSPVTAVSDEKTQTFFSTATGDNTTSYITRIDSAQAVQLHGETKYTLYFRNQNNQIDSSLGHREGFVDTILNINDSIVPANFAPGGLIDGRNSLGGRIDTVVSTAAGRKRVSYWPLSIGYAAQTSPLIADLNHQDRYTDLMVINGEGSLYHWQIDTTRFSTGPQQWSMTGGGVGRSFSLSGSGGSTDPTAEITTFYSYPNPQKIQRGEDDQDITFRYELGASAQEAELRIFTMDGIGVFKDHNLPRYGGVNEYILDDLSFLGSAVYRCILTVTFDDGSEVNSFWKMAILRDGR